MVTIIYDDISRCMWKPNELSRKIESLIANGTIDGDDTFMRFIEYVPSNDFGKTVSDSYVRGGSCLLFMCEDGYVKGGITVKELAESLSSSGVCEDCGEHEAIATIEYDKNSLEGDAKSIKSNCWFVRI